MVRVCCSSFHIGNTVFGKKKPFKDKSKTHGYCPSCFEKEMVKVEKELKRVAFATPINSNPKLRR